MAMVDKLRMAPVSQKLYTKTVSDLGEAVSSELQQLNIGRKIRGKHIAITGGSRGVARIPEAFPELLLLSSRYRFEIFPLGLKVGNSPQGREPSG